MNIVFNFPKDKKQLENGIAHIRAILMQRYIDNLDIGECEKNKIKDCLIEELQKT